MSNSIQFWMQPGFQDWASLWPAQAVTMFGGLDPKCYRTIIWKGPKFANSLIPARQYRQSQLPMLPGSLIVGLSATSNTGDSFSTLITDLSTNRKLMSSPVEMASIGPAPNWLPDLYAITDPGLVRLEIWNTQDFELRPEVTLMIAEPR